jgi:hypothetical protein
MAEGTGLEPVIPVREIVFETIAVAAEPTLHRESVHPPGIGPGSTVPQTAIRSIELWVR